MKPLVPLAASLALNLALAGAYFSNPRTPPFRKVVAAPALSTRATLQIDPTIWPALESTELATLADRLRASGFPPSVVRAVIAAQINEQFAARRRALQAGADDRPFWKEAPPNPQASQAERQMDREQRRLMRELFGDEADADDLMRNVYQNRMFSFLPDEKARELRRVLRDYDDRRSEMFSSSSGGIDREKMAALEKEQRTAIAGVLTPSELFEYDLRNGNTSNSLRDQLSAFNPTEEEFRTVFRLRQAFDEQFSPQEFFMASPDEQYRRSEAERLLNEQIKAALGAARAAEYDRDVDYSYRRTSQLLARLELPPENASALWDLQKEFTQRRNELRRSQTGPVPPGDERLVALQNEAIAKVAPLIGGSKNIEPYKQYGGQWIENLVPRPRTAPK